jgi:predicted RNase H-like nuclease (RuvC/YqgF family)
MKYIKRFQLNENQEEPEFDYNALFNQAQESENENENESETEDNVSKDLTGYNNEVISAVSERIHQLQAEIMNLEYGLSIMEKDFDPNVNYVEQLLKAMDDNRKYHTKERDIMDNIVTIAKNNGL